MNAGKGLAVMTIMAVGVLLLAPSCQPVDNYAPVINSLQADAEWTLTLSSLNVTCNATDRDGDPLTYNWSASGGNITGGGAKVMWTAPEEFGVYYVAVIVSDGQGGTDTDSIALIAATGTLPMIENLIVTAKEPKYLKEIEPGFYKVGKEQEYYVECVVSSNISGELTYEWLCTGGTISGEGSSITWIAPNWSGIVTVTAVVFDEAGKMDKDSVLFKVVSCTHCEFG